MNLIFNFFILICLFFLFQKVRLGKKNLGEVLNGPQREAHDPLAEDEDAALKALAKKFEQKYVSIF